jgi:hypothetical protein
MPKPDHGWKNDETWMVASALDNDERLHEILINEASLALGEALAEGKTGKSAFNVAVSLMIGTLRSRFQRATLWFYDVLSRAKYKLRPEFAEVAHITQRVLVHTVMERVNWREIARHYISAFME